MSSINWIFPALRTAIFIVVVDILIWDIDCVDTFDLDYIYSVTTLEFIIVLSSLVIPHVTSLNGPAYDEKFQTYLPFVFCLLELINTIRPLFKRQDTEFNYSIIHLVIAMPALILQLIALFLQSQNIPKLNIANDVVMTLSLIFLSLLRVPFDDIIDDRTFQNTKGAIDPEQFGIKTDDQYDTKLFDHDEGAE